jgi:hypothetical protein
MNKQYIKSFFRNLQHGVQYKAIYCKRDKSGKAHGSDLLRSFESAYFNKSYVAIIKYTNETDDIDMTAFYDEDIK